VGICVVLGPYYSGVSRKSFTSASCSSWPRASAHDAGMAVFARQAPAARLGRRRSPGCRSSSRPPSALARPPPGSSPHGRSGLPRASCLLHLPGSSLLHLGTLPGSTRFKCQANVKLSNKKYSLNTPLIQTRFGP